MNIAVRPWTSCAPSPELSRRSRIRSIEQSKFYSIGILIPAIACKRPAVADVQIAPFLKLETAAELGVHDRFAGRVLGHSDPRGLQHRLASAQHRPTHQLGDGNDLEMARLIRVIMDTDAVANDVAREIGAVERQPVAQFTF